VCGLLARRAFLGKNIAEVLQRTQKTKAYQPEATRALGPSRVFHGGCNGWAIPGKIDKIIQNPHSTPSFE
jgi:hypothetical protein